MIFTIENPYKPKEDLTFDTSKKIVVHSDPDLKILDQIIEQLSNRPKKNKS